MDDNRVRALGLIGGGGALLIALGVAALGGPEEPAQAPAPPPATDVVSALPSATATAPIPDVETAMAPGAPVAIPRTPQPMPAAEAPVENPNIEFIVRFDDRHSLSRAQALYLQGKHADAATLARETLTRRPEFRGLCFQRFTLGAELVLAHCARVPGAQVQRTSDRWERKLKGMVGVQYADANVIVQPETR